MLVLLCTFLLCISPCADPKNRKNIVFFRNIGDILIHVYFFNFHTKAFVPTCVCYCLNGTLVDYLSFVVIL